MHDLLAELGVSRETTAKLRLFESLVLKWQRTINLVSKDTVSDLWTRHILDSAQLLSVYAQPRDRWLDIGSGGGFPAIIIGILLHELQPTARMTMIESDQRKAAFLRTAARETGIRADVVSKRIDDVDNQKADVLTARALAPLADLLGHAQRHIGENGVALLHKGRNYKAEIADARRLWEFDCELHQSQTNPEARILEVRNILRAEP